MSNRPERLSEIVNVLRVNRASTVRELAVRLNVSDMTIRRDLQLLEDRRMVKTFHGSVVYNQDYNEQDVHDEYSVDTASTRNIQQKQDIGKLAATLVEPDDVLIIDIGSTAEALSRALPSGIELTILCYGLNILREVSRRPFTELIFAGGRFHTDTQMFESSQGIDLIKSTRATKAFVSAAGVNLRLGVTTINGYESDTKRAALNSSLSRILVVDSSKFGKVHSAHFADLNEFEVIVTDRGIHPEYSEAIATLGIRLLLV